MHAYRLNKILIGFWISPPVQVTSWMPDRGDCITKMRVPGLGFNFADDLKLLM